MAATRVNWTDDEIIVAADLVRRNDWHDLRPADPQVIALSELLRSLPANREHAEDPAFRGANSVSRKIGDIVSVHPDYPGRPTKGGHRTVTIVRAFVEDAETMSSVAATIVRSWQEALATGSDPYDAGDVDLPDDDEGVAEGRVLMATHLRRERNAKFRMAKIQSVLRAGGALACEICAFDFGRFYGELGKDYIEVHHIVPLHASGETTTRLADLAVLCSNCHRMIHRRTPWLTPEELRERIRRAG